VSLRWTLGLLAIAAALGAWVWFGEIKGDERKAAADAEGKKLGAVAAKDVSALELGMGDGATVKLARSGAKDWKLEEPVAYPADLETVGRTVEALGKLAYVQKIEPAPADREQFGLGAKARTVRVSTGQAEPVELAIGGATPTGGGKYLALASDPNAVYVVDTAAATSLTPTLQQLRDKRLLRASTGGASELVVKKGGALVVHATRGEGPWQLVEPESAAGDAEKIDRTLEELSLARASDWSPADAKPEAYGLAAPALEVTVVTPAGTEHLALASADGKTWVRREGDPVLLQVNPAVLTGVPTTFFDYRAKRVLTLDTAKVHALELAFPRTGQSHRFELSGNDWKPVEAGLELRPLKIEDLVFAIASLEATSLEPASADKKALGLDPPAVSLRALDDKGAELGALSLGDLSAPAGVPALSSQHPEVWRVPGELGRQIPLSAEAFQNAFVKPPEPAPAAAAPPAPAPSSPASP
jgi:hypothetical protein